MRKGILALLVLLAPAAAQAGVIEQACLSSERSLGNLRLCGCIQDAANMTLSARDQRRAAGFFKEPDRAQRIRMSDRRADSQFWERYKAFGETAEAFCAR